MIHIVEQACSAESPYGSTNNLRTTTVSYPYTNGMAWSGNTKTVIHPDGRMESYSYAYGNYSTNADPSLNEFTVNSTGSYLCVSVTNGTSASPSGIAYKTTKEVTIKDVYGRVVHEETYVYTGSDYKRIKWQVNILNQSGQVIASYRSDNTMEEASWGCCGKEWEKTSEGIEYSMSYDALGRVIQKIKEGCTNTSPAQPDIYTTYTYDAMGRQLSRVTTAGGIYLTNSTQYDLAGRVVQTTDEAGLVTTTAYTNDGRKVMVTMPGGVTRITEHYKDGKIKSITGTGVTAQYYEYGIDEATGWQWTKVYSGSSNSLAWTKTYTDLLGRTIREEKAGFGGVILTNNYTYNNKGQLVKVSGFGSTAPTCYEYDALGNQIRSGQDINKDGDLDLASMDRIQEQESLFEEYDNSWWQKTIQKTYPVDNSAMAVTSSISRTRLSGFVSNITSETRNIDIAGNETIILTAIDRDNRTVITSTDFADSTTDAVTISINGLMQSSRSKTGLITSYGYDAIGRQISVTEPRTGKRLTHYDSKGRIDYVEDAATNRTWYFYSSATGQKIAESNVCGKVTRYGYDMKGQLIKMWGDTVYPVKYEFDTYGRMVSMSTYRGGSGWGGENWPTSSCGTADTTVWQYDEASGLLTNKLYADGKGTRYLYTADGKLYKRIWARKEGTNELITTYSYDNNTGEMTGINYSDDTPDVSFTYNRMGQQKMISDAIGVRTFNYNDKMQLSSEVMVSGLYTNTIVRKYDGFGRVRGFELWGGGSKEMEIGYEYSGVGRISGVTSVIGGGSNRWDYYYENSSELIGAVSNEQSGVVTRKSYESNRDLIKYVKNEVDGIEVSGYYYENDSLGRRVSVKMSGTGFGDMGDGFYIYEYNSRNELTNAVRYFGNNCGVRTNPVIGQAWGYGYDNIGNRQFALSNITNVEVYTANELNQYSERTIPGVVPVLGTAKTNAVVTVNNAAVVRQGRYWYKEVGVSNEVSAVFPLISVVGVYNPPGTNEADIVTTETGHIFVAKSPELYTYDEDGNLTSDGRWEYIWDCENRLIGVETADSVTNVVGGEKLVFGYDYQGRRVRKVGYRWNGVMWVTNEVRHYIYDGWNCVAEKVNRQSAVTTNYYVWGVDLSGSLQGAGGIGGLLCVVHNNEPYFPCYDGNGNITDYAYTNGVVVAHYEYDPFGETMASTGQMKDAFNFRFSTKQFDDTCVLYYYGFRYYNPSLGRWLTRDPLGEQGAKLIAAIHDEASVEGTTRSELFAFLRLIYEILWGAEVFDLAFQYPNSFATPEQRGYWFSIVMKSHELQEEEHLYRFVRNDPLNRFDPVGRKSLFKGKYWGNYCGDNWCGGKNQDERKCSGEVGVPATDDMDKCCKAHDACLGGWDPSTGGSVLPHGHDVCDPAMCSCLDAIDICCLMDQNSGYDFHQLELKLRFIRNLFCRFGPF